MTYPKMTWVAGHLVALAVGIALAMPHAQRQQNPASPEASTTPVDMPPNGASTARHPAGTPNGLAKRPPSSAETYRQAWKALQEQPRTERERLRRLLLSEWAKVDLEGALEAAMLEPDSRNLLDHFAEVFDADPNTIKACFAGEKFGLKTADLRNWWIAKMAARDPGSLFGLLNEFGPVDQGKIVSLCLASTRQDPTRQSEMIQHLTNLDDTATHRKLWGEVARELTAHGDPQAVLDRLCAIPGTAGRVMVGQAMILLLEKTDYAGARASYASLPPDLRRETAEAALVKPGKNPAAYLAAIDEVLHTPDWEKLKGHLGANLHDLSVTSSDSATFLTWAAKLPERDDTLDLYRVAVRGFVTYQPEKARDWIATVPQGWKRENSLAAYAQAALATRQNPTDAKWAIQQMTDPKFKTMAEEWIGYYEKKTGRVYPR